MAGARKAVVRALGTLACEGHEELFLDALTDRSPGVSNAAARALQQRPLMSVAALLGIFRSDSPNFARKNVFRLLCRQPFWAEGIFLFEAVRDRDAAIVDLGLKGLSNRIIRSRGIPSSPTKSELALLWSSLWASAGMLPTQQFRECEFALKSYA